MAPNIQIFDAGDLKLNPSETGVEAQAGTARRVGMFSNQAAGAEDMLARETSRLASQTEQLGGETSRLGGETSRLGSEKGAALADTGRRIGSSITDAGAVGVQYLEHKDINQGSAAWSRLLAQKTQDWNNTVKNADPNDPTIAAKFMDSLESDLTNFKEQGFLTEGGQKFAESHVEALRQHFAEKTIGDMSQLAGQAAVVNQQQTINSLSSTVHGDPSSLDFSLAALKSSTEGMIASSPNLTGTQASAARSEILQKGAESIVKSAAIGYIEKTAQVPPWATDPKYAPYINGAELKTFENAAKTQAKVNAYYDKQTAVAQRQLNDLQVHQNATKVITDNVSLDPATGRPLIDPKFFKQALDIARQNPDAPSAAATVRTMLDWGEQQQKSEDAVSDPAVRQQLFDGMLNNTKPITMIDVLRAQADQKLSNKDAALMKDILAQNAKGGLNDPVFVGVMGAAKNIIHQSFDGQENYAKFFYSFVRDYQKRSANGTLQPNALDVRDDNSLISQYLKQYQPTPAQKMQYHVFKNLGVNANDPDLIEKAFGKTSTATPLPVDREAGRTYPTPRGPMKWTGTGWVPPDATPSERPGPAVTPPIKVSTPTDAQKLAPGTRYETPDGKVYVR